VAAFWAVICDFLLLLPVYEKLINAPLLLLLLLPSPVVVLLLLLLLVYGCMYRQPAATVT
jgi:hypothetical protein